MDPAETPERAKHRPPSIPPSEKLAYSVAEACAIAGFKKSKAWELIRSGELKSVKRAGRRLVLREDLIAYLRGAPA